MTSPATTRKKNRMETKRKRRTRRTRRTRGRTRRRWRREGQTVRWLVEYVPVWNTVCPPRSSHRHGELFRGWSSKRPAFRACPPPELQQQHASKHRGTKKNERRPPAAPFRRRFLIIHRFDRDLGNYGMNRRPGLVGGLRGG